MQPRDGLRKQSKLARAQRLGTRIGKNHYAAALRYSCIHSFSKNMPQGY